MAIMSQTEMPNEAWTFLKWWSSDEVQAEFGSLLQSTYGSEYIWPTANTSAFATLQRLGWNELEVVSQLAPGVIKTKAPNGTFVIMKPGSYSWGFISQ
jgi:ABC-type glycerol-3-phosphate transport system substrate-binding protein